VHTLLVVGRGAKKRLHTILSLRLGVLNELVV
jgi:hypothetical protein